jgi:hypothetical protein
MNKGAWIKDLTGFDVTKAIESLSHDGKEITPFTMQVLMRVKEDPGNGISRSGHGPCIPVRVKDRQIFTAKAYES